MGKSRTTAERKLSARDRAVEALLLVDAGEGFAAEQLDQLQREEPIGAADVGLANEIVLGVLRHRLAISHVVGVFVRGQWSRLDPALRWILAVAAYQLCYLERVPDFAAVDAAVEQAKGAAGQKAGGLVNAVLRSLLRSRGERVTLKPGADARRALRIDAERGYVFADAIWPDPKLHATEFLSLTTSTPLWIVRRWVDQFGREVAERICAMNSRRPPVVLRANTMRIKPAALAKRLSREGAATKLDGKTGAIEVELAGPITRLSEFQEGLCQPQDATAQMVWSARPPRAGELVVDLCAGVGTKATHAAELMDDRGIVIASDTNLDRLRLAADNAARLGLAGMMCVTAVGLAASLKSLGRSPDVIVIDAPCSNSGTLARRPEARYRLNAAAIRKLAGIQLALLNKAAKLAGAGTTIIYSTCSIEAEENEEVVMKFCRQRRGWRPEHSKLTRPDAGDETRVWRDGGFAAVLSQSPAARENTKPA